MSKTIPQVPLLVESTLYVRTKGSGSKVSSLSKIARVRIAGAHKELVRDVRDVITGFLKNNCMKLTTGSGDNVSRISARRAWIPLKEGKTKLMMHEITVGCIKITVPDKDKDKDEDEDKDKDKDKDRGKGKGKDKDKTKTRTWIREKEIEKKMKTKNKNSNHNSKNEEKLTRKKKSGNFYLSTLNSKRKRKRKNEH